ncbi:HAMP domain-containing sensor histidine kinase, partial [Clostridium butyricum]
MARKSKKHSIRCRILKSLINLIAVIFFIIVILFNLLVNRYIEKSAKYKLENIKFISQDNEDVSIKEKFPDKEMNTEDKKYIHIIKRVQEQS